MTTNNKTLENLFNIQDKFDSKFINTLINNLCINNYVISDELKSNNSIDYIIKDNESDLKIRLQPLRNECIIYNNNIKLMEIYPSKKGGYKNYIRGLSLQHMPFKDTKKENAILGILKESIKYNEKNDFKHSFKATLEISSLIWGKLLKLDKKAFYNEGILWNDNQFMNSKKAIKIDDLQVNKKIEKGDEGE